MKDIAYDDSELAPYAGTKKFSTAPGAKKAPEGLFKKLKARLTKK